MTICFNTFAVLFVLDCDNYAHALVSNEKLAMASKVGPKVEFDRHTVCVLGKARTLHMKAIWAAIVLSVSPWWSPEVPQARMVLIVMAFLVVNCVHAFRIDYKTDLKARISACFWVLAQWVLGVFGMGALVLVTFVFNHHSVSRDFADHKFEECTPEEKALDVLNIDCDM